MHLLIFLIAFFEGFTTLSIEIIAIRNFTPIIGTNSISTSVILGVILLALSYGYYIGGKATKGFNKKEITNKIIFNLAIASMYYLYFTFVVDEGVLSMFISVLDNYFLAILITSVILFFIPVFLASQTVPLLSELWRGDNTGEKIGKLLFFSTIGSFVGSVMTSTVLFSTIGVSKAAVLNSIILIVLAIILIIINKQKVKFLHIIVYGTFIVSVIMIFGSERLLGNVVYKKANSYHNIVIFDDNANRRIFSQNGGYASGIDKHTKNSFFKYIIEVKENIISRKSENILIIGAAGFTLPRELSYFDHVKSIDVVDVDSELKDISEKYFLEEKLSEKISFVSDPSRFFINNTIRNEIVYDAILIDVYVGNNLPPQTLTKEFFDGINMIGKDVYLNIITDTKLESKFSKTLFKTMKSSFGNLYYKDVNRSPSRKTNFIVTNGYIDGYKEFEGENKYEIYTDDRNSIEIDLFELL